MSESTNITTLILQHLIYSKYVLHVILHLEIQYLENLSNDPKVAKLEEKLDPIAYALILTVSLFTFVITLTMDYNHL